MDKDNTLGQRLGSLLDTPSVKVVVEARLGNCGTDFQTMADEGLASLKSDEQFLMAAGDVVSLLKVHTRHI